jgi:hypothetical protein
MMKEGMRVAVIGGGAAGFFAALSVAEHHPNARVVLLEKSSKLLAKVKISGGGRCNVTHACFTPSALSKNYPRGGKLLKKAFTQFQSTDTIDWFTHRGVPLKTESDGRMFPESDSSQSIIDCLMQEARKKGVEIKLQTPVQSIVLFRGEFQLNADRFDQSSLPREEAPSPKVLIGSGPLATV